ncbi:MAG TPA: TonB-dependent receptor [Terriglobia bacterium]|nr:TonB-dependent receptor [Terriglobia bacterium]
MPVRSRLAVLTPQSSHSPALDIVLRYLVRSQGRYLVQSQGLTALLVAVSVALVAVCTIFPGRAMAQSAASVATGTLTGHVRGPGDVAVPGATVELINTQTGEHKETWTDAAGNYTLGGVPPGTYKLQISLLGFQTDVREPVPVAAGKSLKVNSALVLTLPGRAVAGRRPGGSFASLSPEMQARIRAMMAQGGGGGEGGLDGGAMGGMGASLAGAGQGQQGEVRFSASAAGAQAADTSGQETDSSSAESGASAANSFLLSGSVGQAPTPQGEDQNQTRERFREFRQSQQGAPGFGGGGGFGDAVMFWGGAGRRRPRANRLRGNVFERYSNSALDARPYALNAAPSPQIASHSEQAGFAVGGPLVIPKIYHGADKTSFFVHYNLQRSRNPFDNFATVPTLAERAGDFSQTVIPSGPLAGTVAAIYDPQSNPLGPRTAFPNNQIPTARLDPAAVALLKYIPTPNLPGSVQNFHLREALQSNSDRAMGRIGHQISDKDSVNVFYFFNSARSLGVSSFPELTSSRSVRSQNLNLGESHTFSPHVINSITVNFNRQRVLTLNPFAFQQDIASQLGIQGVSTNPFDWGIPIVGFTNFNGLNDTIPSLVRNQTVRALDFVTWNAGKHNLRFGGEIRRVQDNTLTDPDARGTFTFTGYTTSNFTASGAPVAGTGFDFADFLLGLPQTTSVRFGTSSNYLRSWVYSGFVQDDWRASSRLTFNLGLRYEYFQPFTEKYGHLSDLAIAPNYATVGVVTGLAPDGFPASLIRGAPKNLAPRLGLAYRPWSSHQFVVRAGFGIFYDGSIFNRLTPNLTDQPPFAEASTLLTSATQVLTLENGFPVIASNVARNTYAVDPNFKAPYGESWNFSMEDQIVRDVILSVGYVGTKGTHLDLLLAPTTAFALTGAAANASQKALAFTYETSGADSIYNGLQVSLRRQFHNGFSLSGNYTYSKSIDDASSVGGVGNIVAQNFLDLQAERGLSTFDMRHNFRMNYNYEFPFGDRKRYLNRGGGMARVLGNWQLAGYGTIQSGTPFTARLLGNQSNNTGAGPFFANRPDATGQPVALTGSQQSTLLFFNTAAFALPPPGEFGNAGRDTISGPHNISFNTSLDRHIDINREKGVRLDFRIEANNIFNTPNFGSLATVINATNFGRVLSVRGMRTVDASLRLRF